MMEGNFLMYFQVTNKRKTTRFKKIRVRGHRQNGCVHIKGVTLGEELRY